MHPGHVALLKRAKEEYGYVVVSLNSDEFATKYKRKPLMTMLERMNIMSACKYVDEVIMNVGGEDSTPAILTSQAKVIVHGDDWQGEPLMQQMGLTQEFLDKHGIQMVYYKYTPGISTSDLLCRLASLPPASVKKD